MHEKTYIGREEAWEICLANGHNLPRKNREIMHARSALERILKPDDIIGKDEQGYYVIEL